MVCRTCTTFAAALLLSLGVAAFLRTSGSTEVAAVVAAETPATQPSAKPVNMLCPITKEPIEEGFGFMLTTAQIVASKKYWDMVMTEPETMSYTVSHFKNQSSGTQMRNMIFEKYSSIEKPWMISDSCINLFDVDKQSARENAKKWWANEGNYHPDNSGPAAAALGQAWCSTATEESSSPILNSGNSCANSAWCKA